MYRQGFLMAVVCALAACSMDGSGASGGAPALQISWPADNAVVKMETGSQVPIEFDVSGFQLAQPGTCAAAGCGHVHLKIDGEACNDTGAHKPYNAAGFGSPMMADLALCPTQAGQHVVILELHADDHSPITDASGAAVRAGVAFTATVGY